MNVLEIASFLDLFGIYLFQFQFQAADFPYLSSLEI